MATFGAPTEATNGGPKPESQDGETQHEASQRPILKEDSQRDGHSSGSTVAEKGKVSGKRNGLMSLPAEVIEK